MANPASGPAPGYRNPQAIPRGPVRCSGTAANNGLAVGNATANGVVAYEIVPVFGAARLRVRIKTATNGGTLDVFFVGPDFDLSQGSAAVAYGSLTGTIYTTGNPAQVAVTAGTEAKADVDCYGEGHAIIKFTGTVGAGTITYCDYSQV